MIRGLDAAIKAGGDFRTIKRLAKREWAKGLFAQLDNDQLPLFHQDRAKIETLQHAFQEGSDTEIFQGVFWAENDQEIVDIITSHWSEMSLPEILCRIARGAELTYNAGETSYCLGWLAFDITRIVLERRKQLVELFGSKVINSSGEPDFEEAEKQVEMTVLTALDIAKYGTGEAIRRWGGGNLFAAGLLIGKEKIGLEKLTSLLTEKGIMDEVGNLRLKLTPVSPEVVRPRPKLLPKP